MAGSANLSTLQLAAPEPLAACGHETMPQRPMRSWSVLHACEQVEQAMAIVEGQIAAGMRPLLVTPQGRFGMGARARAEIAVDSAQRISVRYTWRDARRWARVMRAEMSPDTDIFHAYCLAAAIGGLRNFPVVVYDASTLLTDHNRGLNALSLHVLRRAESFVLAHAAAVVVHSPAMRRAVLARDTHPEDIFLVPSADCRDSALIGQAYDAVYRHAIARHRKDPRTPIVKLQPINASL